MTASEDSKRMASHKGLHLLILLLILHSFEPLSDGAGYENPSWWHVEIYYVTGEWFAQLVDVTGESRILMATDFSPRDVPVENGVLVVTRSCNPTDGISHVSCSAPWRLPRNIEDWRPFCRQNFPVAWMFHPFTVSKPFAKHDPLWYSKQPRALARQGLYHIHVGPKDS